MEQIIGNGLNSIRVGLEDFEQAQKGQNGARLTSAVRNIYAAILILAKGKLYELSPPETPGILIHALRPKLVNGRIELAQDGRKTIGYEEIKQRFKHFDLPFDWSGVDRVRDIRNDLEHFYHGGSQAAVSEALADAAIAIRCLLGLLRLDPVHDLGERYWAILLRNEELFNNELADCRANYAQVNWINPTAAAAGAHFSCQNCRSQLIRQADSENREQDGVRPVCAACGAESDIGALMEHAVTQQYYRELYETQTRGGEPPVVRCPHCKRYALALEASECAACGNTLGPDTGWCKTCHNPVSPEEMRTNTHECPAFYIE